MLQPTLELIRNINTHKTRVYVFALLGVFLVLFFLSQFPYFSHIITSVIAATPFAILILFVLDYYLESRHHYETLPLIRRAYLQTALKVLSFSLLLFIVFSPSAWKPYLLFFTGFIERIFNFDNYILFAAYAGIIIISILIIFFLVRIYQKYQGKYAGSLKKLFHEIVIVAFVIIFFLLVSSASAHPNDFAPITEAVSTIIYNVTNVNNFNDSQENSSLLSTTTQALKKTKDNIADRLDETAGDLSSSLKSLKGDLEDSIAQTKNNLQDEINKKLSLSGGTINGDVTINGTLTVDDIDGLNLTDYLELSGGTMSGSLTLNGDPSGDNQAATKSYVDTHGGGGSADGNNYPVSISFSGTTTKTLTLARSGLSDLTANFSDLNTTYTAEGQGLELSGTEFALELNGGTLAKGSSGLKIADSYDDNFLTTSTVLAPDHGGTGLTAYTAGDILYAANATTLAKLAIGGNGTVLTVISGVPTWSTASLHGAVTLAGTHSYLTLAGQEITLGQIDISEDTNLTGDSEIILTGDALSIASTLTRDSEWNTQNKVETIWGVTLATDSELSSVIGTHAALTTGTHGVTGTIVGTSDLQALTNKTGNISMWTNDVVYITDGNSGWDNSYGFITDGNTGWDNSYGYITASSSDALTNKTGNISMWTNNSGYITASSIDVLTNKVWNGGMISPIYGGTGIASYTIGDLFYASGATALSKLGIGSAGQLLTISGGIPSWTIATYPGSTTANRILYSSANNTVAELTSSANSILATNGSSVPAWATDIPTAVTIGSAYIYRAGGTDIPVTDGGTGAGTAIGARTNLGVAASGANSDITSLSGLTTALSVAQGGTGAGTLTSNGILYGNATGAIQATAAGTNNYLLYSNSGTPAWTNAPTILGTNITGIPNGALTNSSLTIGSTAISLGGTSTTLAGLTSVTSTGFTGSLTGNASTVTNGAYTNAANSFSLINPLTTIAESWIGPSSTTGIYFKGGNVGIGTTNPTSKLYILSNSAATPALSLESAASTTSDYFQVRSNGASAGDIFTINSSGRVGIGTAAPSEQLDIANNIRAGGYISLWAGGVNAYNTSLANSLIYNSTGTGAAYPFLEYGNLVLQSRASSGARDIVFATGITTPAARMVIDRTGNVGIGTTSPGAKLDVTGSVTGSSYGVGIGNQVAVTAPTHDSFGIYNYSTLINSTTGRNAATLYTGGSVTAGTGITVANATGLYIDSLAKTGAGTITNTYGLKVYGSVVGTNNYAAAFMGGNVGIGTTNPGAKLDVNGSLNAANSYTRFDAYSVPTATYVPINVSEAGTTMVANTQYRVQLVTSWTGVSSGAVYIVTQIAASTWVATPVSYNGIGSNHPLLRVNGSTLEVYHQHASTYNINVRLNSYNTGNLTTAATFFGLESAITNYGGNVGIGTTNPGNLLEVKGTAGTTGIMVNDVKGSSGGTSRVQFGLSDGAFITNDAARIEARVVANPNMALDFKTYHGSLQTDMTIYNGNVGIGTTAPNGKLDVSSASTVLAITDTSGLVANTGGKLSFYNQYNSGGTFNPYASIRGIRENTTSASNSGALLFFTGANGSGGVLPEVMRINSSGNVGIGTTNPAGVLDISQSNPSNFTRFYLRNTSTSGYSSGIALMSSASLAAERNWLLKSSVVENGDFVIQTTNAIGTDPFYAAVTTRLLIDNAGNVGIGTTAPNTKLAVAGLTGTSSYNYVRVNTTTGDFYYDSSSERYKSNIQPLEDDFLKVLELQPKLYTDRASGQNEIGYIAEDLDALGLTHLVIYRNGRPDAIKYERIPLYLTEVMKEQQNQIAGLSDSRLSLESNVSGLTLKTDENVTTLTELKISTDKNLAIISQNINDLVSGDKSLKDQIDKLNTAQSLSRSDFDNQESRIKSVEDLMATLQAQIDELKKLTNQDMNLAQIEASKNDIDYIKLVLGLDRAENDSIHLLGNLEAEGVETGKLVIKIIDKDAATIGKAIITAGEAVVVVKTKAVTKNSKIYLTPVGSTKNQVLYVGNISEGENFEVKVDNPVTEDIGFNWWIVESR